MILISAAIDPTGNTVALALFELAFAIFGYKMSLRHLSQRGVTPWRLPSVVWGLICFAIGPIGIVVELFAGVTTRPTPAGEMARPRPSAAFELPSTDVRSGTRIADPSPGASSAPVADVQVRPLTAGRYAPPLDKDGSTARFGWYPDVTGRHEQRYFDGKYWGEQVLDGDVQASDPLV
jgi:Protein of unknown function (DUF2510)